MEMFHSSIFIVSLLIAVSRDHFSSAALKRRLEVVPLEHHATRLPRRPPQQDDLNRQLVLLSRVRDEDLHVPHVTE